MTIIDHFHRTIDYMRISVTDRCNLRCVYCMPEEGIEPLSHNAILRYEEIVRIVRLAAGLGISHLRLTGGEPLVRRGLPSLVLELNAVPGIESLAMTTNGTLLDQFANELKAAGLQRVNISLDTLRPDRYHAITRRGELDDVLRGIEHAQIAGLEPVKVNMVVMRDTNDDEVVDFAHMSVEKAWNVRYIEVMPLGKDAWINHDVLVPTAKTRDRIEGALGALEPAELVGSGPARVWRIPGAEGTLGFISAVTEHFCPSCNRLRLTANGGIVPCLFSAVEFDIAGPMRAGATDDELASLLRQAIGAKPDGHHIGEQVTMMAHEMSRMGG